jgi:single-strand DNA-binding protein
METLVGRVTGDAKVNALKDERKVVNFSIAINDSYKQKGTSEVKKLTTYVNCSYWLSDAIAAHLTKGTLVEVYGRISASAWTNLKGEAVANLNFHVNSIKLHGKGKTESQAMPAGQHNGIAVKDDLPF